MPPNIVTGTLQRRYKRFLADVRLADGTRVTAHCPNTGAMTGCDIPGSRVWLSVSDNPRRKYAHTWELVRVPDGAMVGINTGRANQLVAEALQAGVIRALDGYTRIRPEVAWGERSRFDFLLEGGVQPDCLVEVKSVTLSGPAGWGLFPDAKSQRATRHLRGLIQARESGLRAVNLFCAQRDDVARIAPADEIDPDYGRVLRDAAGAGVEIIGCVCELSPREIRIKTEAEVVLS